VPNTSNYDFEYESPSSLPGTTLTGGPGGGSPILAIQVDSALAAIETKVDINAANITENTASIESGATALTNLENWTRTGTVNMSFTTTNASTTAVNFGFTFPGVPKVFGNIDSGAGATARWIARPINITTTGFTMFVFSGSADVSTWVDVPVNWLAHYDG
jgi:hypothetical protein